MPTIYYHLARDPWWAALFAHVPMNGAAFLLCLNGLLMAIFNGMVLAIFSYLYWDVVPQEVLGRFSSLTKIVLAVMSFVWNFFFFGLAQHHMKPVCVGIALFCLVVYLLSVWKIKEGEYPPPDQHKKGGVFAPFRAYVVECYSDPYYLWIFGSLWLFGMANGANNLKNHLIMFDLNLSWTEIGRLNSVPGIIAIALGFFFGSMVDRLQPVRLLAPVMAIWACTSLASYFFVHGAMSYLICTCMTQVANFAYGVTYGALLPEIYPMEKLGQFCSASVLFNWAIGFFIGIPLGWLMDHMPNDQICFLWAAAFQFLAAIVWVKVLMNFNRRRGRAPVPHAG
jgi:MFS-type transporter involved in bile tolerance (Atg22 family)